MDVVEEPPLATGSASSGVEVRAEVEGTPSDVGACYGRMKVKGMDEQTVA